MKKNPYITVIIPAYNEEENIAKVLEKLNEALESNFNAWEVVVVNDGSTDKTKSVCQNAGVRVVSHPYNIGNGAAVKTGIRNATGEIIVFMDGDGQHDPNDIPRLVSHIENYDMVVGARRKESKTHLHRRIANYIYSSLATYISGFKVGDLTSGFRVVRQKVARKFIYLLPNTFSYPTTITLALLMTGHSVRYEPIVTQFRGGKSKIRLLRDGVGFLLIIVRIATFFSPFKVFLPISFTCFILGTLNYLYSYLISGRFTNMSALLYMTSVIIFMMGLVANQVAQLRLDRSERD